MTTHIMPAGRNWRLIPGYTKYYFGELDDAFIVQSYHIDKVYGRRLTYSKAVAGYPAGWTLSSNGSKRKVDVSDIKRIFERQDAIEQRKQSQKEQKMNKGFIVGSITNGVYSFSPKPMVHCGEQQARNEVERLARSNPGKEFVYLEIKASCVTNTVTWK
jgi:hypothetical protein